MQSALILVSAEDLILIVRGQKVILDTDLARLYGVSTKALNQAVKRNKQRFPSDFMFQLTQEEKEEVVTNCDHLFGEIHENRLLLNNPSSSIPTRNHLPVSGSQ